MDAITETTIIQAIHNNIATVTEEGAEETIVTMMIDHRIALIINPVNVADTMVI